MVEHCNCHCRLHLHNDCQDNLYNYSKGPNRRYRSRSNKCQFGLPSRYICWNHKYHLRIHKQAGRNPGGRLKIPHHNSVYNDRLRIHSNHRGSCYRLRTECHKHHLRIRLNSNQLDNYLCLHHFLGRKNRFRSRGCRGWCRVFVHLVCPSRSESLDPSSTKISKQPYVVSHPSFRPSPSVSSLHGLLL
jgi:hypothetical protein